MGVENPTGTDSKAETADQPKTSDQAPPVYRDQPGSPEQPSRRESRSAAQQPYEPGTDDKREVPPPARSIRAENSNDPNDDPNRIGTPRADSLAIARGEKPEPPAQKQDAETTAGTPEPQTERPPGTSGTPRADSMAIARGEKLETDEPEPDAAGTDLPGTPTERPNEAGNPADDDRESDNAASPGEQGTDTKADAPEPQADPASPGEQPLGEQDSESSKQDTPANLEPQKDQPPAPEAPQTDEPADSTPQPHDGTGQKPPQDAQPLDHGILDNRAEDAERPAETNPSQIADGKPPAETGETGEHPGETPPAARETEPLSEAPPAPADGEPPVQAEQDAPEQPEPTTESQDGVGSEPEVSRDTRAQGTEGRGIGESDDGGHDHGRKAEDPAEPSASEEAEDPFASLPTREDLDPAAAGMWAAHRGELTPVDENQDLTESDPEDEDYSKRIMRALRDNSDDMQKNVNDISSDLGDALPKPTPPKGKTGTGTQYTPSPDAPNQGVHGADIAIAAVAGFMVVERTYQFGKRKIEEFTGRRRDDN